MRDFRLKQKDIWLLVVATFRLLAVPSYFYFFSLSPLFPFTENCGELSQRCGSVRHGLLIQEAVEFANWILISEALEVV